jgi:HEPN domain-containing protein
VPAKGKRVKASRSEARSYLAKADQFIDTANSAARESSHDATMLNAIHAAISAADAVTVVLAGVRSTDPDHLRVVDLLDEVAGGRGDLSKQASQLRQLLSRKNIVEYESRRASAREAADALKRAGRLVAWARQVVDSAKI